MQLCSTCVEQPGGDEHAEGRPRVLLPQARPLRHRHDQHGRRRQRAAQGGGCSRVCRQAPAAPADPLGVSSSSSDGLDRLINQSIDQSINQSINQCDSVPLVLRHTAPSRPGHPLGRQVLPGGLRKLRCTNMPVVQPTAQRSATFATHRMDRYCQAGSSSSGAVPMPARKPRPQRSSTHATPQPNSRASCSELHSVRSAVSHRASLRSHNGRGAAAERHGSSRSGCTAVPASLLKSK